MNAHQPVIKLNVQIKPNHATMISDLNDNNKIVIYIKIRKQIYQPIFHLVHHGQIIMIVIGKIYVVFGINQNVTNRQNVGKKHNCRKMDGLMDVCAKMYLLVFAKKILLLQQHLLLLLLLLLLVVVEKKKKNIINITVLCRLKAVPIHHRIFHNDCWPKIISIFRVRYAHHHHPVVARRR